MSFATGNCFLHLIPPVTLAEMHQNLQTRMLEVADYVSRFLGVDGEISSTRQQHDVGLLQLGILGFRRQTAQVTEMGDHHIGEMEECDVGESAVRTIVVVVRHCQLGDAERRLLTCLSHEMGSMMVSMVVRTTDDIRFQAAGRRRPGTLPSS